MAREQDMKQTRKKHGAAFKAKVALATSVFEGGGAVAEDTASAAQVDVLYRQIGELKVETDFLSRNPRT